MKTIIAAFDALKFSNSTKGYSIYFANISKAHLTGVFLDDFSYTSYKLYELVEEDGRFVKKLNELDKEDLETRKHSAKIFEDACKKEDISYSIHHDRHFAIKELIHETIYNDLLVIHSVETLTHYQEKLPTNFIQHTLAKTHCPVIVVPDKFKPVEKIIFLYDGTPSSVYAIKMFSNIFHSFKHLPVETLSVNTSNQSPHLPDNKLMREFMTRRFPKASYTILKGEPSSEIRSYLNTQYENLFVVLGAYSRGGLSRLIDESMADVLMKNLRAPLFIAHN